jgi:hypothetical protein
LLAFWRSRQDARAASREQAVEATSPHLDIGADRLMGESTLVYPGGIANTEASIGSLLIATEGSSKWRRTEVLQRVLKGWECELKKLDVNHDRHE